MGLRLGIIGAGNMGYAILKGAIEHGVLAPGRAIVVDADPGKRIRAAGLGCAVSDHPGAAATAEQILLAVKPQDFSKTADAVGRLSRPTVVISVMAGLSSGVIRKRLGPNARVVRVMPNTPCQIGDGMSGIAVGEGAEPGDEELAISILDAIGETVLVDESLMYAVTAVSGSGPAYVFLVAEAMETAARAVGLDDDVARLLVQQTLRGAANLMLVSGENPGDLRRTVTSKGGTTAAALEAMTPEHMCDLFTKAITAARDRGRELDVLE